VSAAGWRPVRRENAGLHSKCGDFYVPNDRQQRIRILAVTAENASSSRYGEQPFPD
jgi:hypothetical protein